MKIKIAEIAGLLEELAPGVYQEDYDNVGLIVGDPESVTDKAIISLDVTEEVVDEAIEQKAGLIISHHPPIFSGLKRITGRNDTERAILKAIRSNINLYAIHTNLDNVYGGVNGMLCEKIGLLDPFILKPARGMLKKLVTFCPVEHAVKVRDAILGAGAGHIGNYDYCSYNLEGYGTFRAGEGTDPFAGRKHELHYEKETRIESIFPAHLEKRVVAAMKEAHPYEEVAYDIYPLDNADPGVGSGMIGSLEVDMDATDFLHHLKGALRLTFLRHSPLTGSKVRKVAVCGGAGSFMMTEAVQAGADAFVTADIKYHQFFEAGKMLMVDAGHYETEQFTSELIFRYLKEKITNFALQISKVNTNPIKYL